MSPVAHAHLSNNPVEQLWVQGKTAPVLASKTNSSSSCDTLEVFLTLEASFPRSDVSSFLPVRANRFGSGHCIATGATTDTSREETLVQANAKVAGP